RHMSLMCLFELFGNILYFLFFFFFSSRRRHTRLQGDWSSDVCSSDLAPPCDCDACEKNSARCPVAPFAALPAWASAPAKRRPEDYPHPQTSAESADSKFSSGLLNDYSGPSSRRPACAAPPPDSGCAASP